MKIANTSQFSNNNGLQFRGDRAVCSSRTTRRIDCRMNIPISSWIVFVGKSVPSINYMVWSRWVAHTAPKIKYSALIWKHVITITPSRDSIPFPGFNQCDKSNTLRLLIRSRSQISISDMWFNSFHNFENFKNNSVVYTQIIITSNRHSL